MPPRTSGLAVFHPEIQRHSGSSLPRAGGMIMTEQTAADTVLSGRLR